MILLLDIGNTSIGIGIAKNNKVINTFRLNTETSKSADEYYSSFKSMIDLNNIYKVAISSVVPRVTEIIKKMCVKYLDIDPFIVIPGVKTGINIKTDNPKEVGSDLICDVAALEESTMPTLIVDLGTANKYLYVKNNTLIGAVITPGIAISAKALIGSTALLPDFELEVPKTVLGTNTNSCMQSGVTYGAAAQIDGLIELIREEVKEDFNVIYTGGLSGLVSTLTKTKAIRDPKLTINGLLKILLKNQ